MGRATGRGNLAKEKARRIQSPAAPQYPTEGAPQPVCVNHNPHHPATQFTGSCKAGSTRTNKRNPKARGRQQPPPPEDRTLTVDKKVLHDTGWHWNQDRYVRLTLLAGPDNGQRAHLSEKLIFDNPGYPGDDEPPATTAVGVPVKPAPPRLNASATVEVGIEEVVQVL